MDDAIIIKKVKKGGGHGHHGGAWKVAYADFVTAMMAFFLLLWLLNATTEVQKQGIADYFSPISVSRNTGGAGGMLGGIMVYDITDPNAPDFLLYQNDRDYSLPDNDLANPMGPEGMVFVDAADNALGKNLLIVANEVSGSTDVYSVEAIPLPPTVALLAGGLLGLGLLRRRKG